MEHSLVYCLHFQKNKRKTEDKWKTFRMTSMVSDLTSFECDASSKTIQNLILEKGEGSQDQVFDESFKSSNSVERLCEFVGSILIIVRSR